MSSSNMPTEAPGFAPRRSSYASVVSGMPAGNQYPQILRSGAFSHLTNPDADLGYDSTYHHLGGYPRTDPRAYDMDVMASWGTHARSASSGRGGQLPSFSSAFAPLMNGHGFGTLGGGHPDHFFTPSYLKGSKYVQRLEEAHKAKMAAQKDGHSAHSSQPGSLSTSASSINLHTKMAPSHRGMTYDLIEKAPPVDDDTLAPLPTKWNSQDKYGGLDVLSDGQEVKFTGPKPDRDRDLEACAIRADHPMPPQCGIYYFEVTIISRKREESSIGIGFSTKNVPLSRLPGWEPESWAYHGDDGHSFCCNSSGKHYGPPFNAGDIIGCGINFRTNSAFYTKNGDHLGTAFRDINKEKLYPSIGMKKAGEHIRVNFGQSPFVFDMDGMMSASNNFFYPSTPPAPGSGEDNPPDGSNGTVTMNDTGILNAQHFFVRVQQTFSQSEDIENDEEDEYDDTPPLVEASATPVPPNNEQQSQIFHIFTNRSSPLFFIPSIPSFPQWLTLRLVNVTWPPVTRSTTMTEVHTGPPSSTSLTARATTLLGTVGAAGDTDYIRRDRTILLLGLVRRDTQNMPLEPDERLLLQLAATADQARASFPGEADLRTAYSNVRSLERNLEMVRDRVWVARFGAGIEHADHEHILSAYAPSLPPNWGGQTLARRRSMSINVNQQRQPRQLAPAAELVGDDARSTGPLVRTPWAPAGSDQYPAPFEGRLSDGRNIRIGLAGNNLYVSTFNSTTPNESSGNIFGRVSQNSPQPARRLLEGQINMSSVADSEKQLEKKQIKQQIEMTSTANLAPPLSETDLIQSLVLQFLSHDGYVETARAFAEEIFEEKKALNLDSSEIIQGPDVKEDEDAGHRQRIRKAVLEGDIEKAFKHAHAFYPNVLKDNEHVSFRLKCRKFIEMIRQGAEMQNSSPSNGARRSTGHNGDWYDDIINHDMDLDDHQSQSNSNSNWDRMDTEESSENQTEYHQLLQDTLAYGQLLQAEYKDDPRREVQKALEDAFALIAYQDPLNTKEVSHLLDPSGRAAVAEELNSAILLSLGKSSTAALEKLIQQTTILLEDLGEGGGPGAFVSIDDFVKVKPGIEM
ncbi:hypothetical protein LZ554_006043 [Drepanopeziza brunnea f. sp. 'monogermtubi']|nr:hypothetical protein LZ554_006043 [Drepanopeziza brunnea f. sp. 'monogermtubi']